MKRGAYQLLLLFVMTFLCGCFNNARSRYYPNFAENQKSSGAIRILSDIFIVTLTSASIGVIDVSQNKAVANEAMKIATSELIKNGYLLDGADLICIGCFVPSSGTVKIVTSGSTATSKSNTAPPVYVPLPDDIAVDEQRLTSLLRLLDLSWKKKMQESNPIHPELKSLFTRKGDAVVLYLYGGWQQATTSKALSESMATGATSALIFGVPIVSGMYRPLTVQLRMFKPSTGEVIWTDGQVLVLPGQITEADFEKVLTTLLRRIPKRE